MKSLADKLFNKFDSAAKNWGLAAGEENIPNRTLLRVRNAYYKARNELVTYLEGLERTDEEQSEQIEKMGDQIHDLEVLLGNTAADRDRLAQEIENRNRTKEMGEDEIAAKYILRLGIPELTEVFNRTVLGK